MTASARFSFGDDPIALPAGAWASGERRTLRYDGRPLLSLSQGRRAYVFPLYTPAGFAVTSECPADHPHHNSFWIAADHVHCRMPAAGGRLEEYTYNFYVNDVFQGRAPGRIVATAATGEATGPSGFRIVQTIEWRGPDEWAAPEGGRLAARETRILRIGAEEGLYVIDVESQLSAAGWDFTIGPTRHSYFNVRLAESIAVTSGGALRDDRGRSGGEAISGAGAKWIDYCGPVGGGHVAGVAVCPDPRDHADLTWFVTDWGVVTVGPFRERARLLRAGETLTLRYRTLVHDGSAEEAGVAERLRAYLDECGGG
jgi:hypothetical protein